jgi:hypothetical protein
VRHWHYNRENNEVVELPVAHQSITEFMLVAAICMPHAMQIRQTGGPYPQPLAFIPGLEGAGTVEAVAPDVLFEVVASGKVRINVHLTQYPQELA